MREKRPLKTLLAALFVVSSLAMPVTFLTADAPIPPTLDFAGMEIHVLPDDKDGENIQLLLTVALENVPYSAGTSFRLQYNDRYLVPSAQANNAPLDAVNTGVLTPEKRYFSIDPALYGGNDPFYESTPASNIAQGQLDTKSNYLAMNLQVKQTLTDTAKVGAVDSKLSVDGSTAKRYYLDCAGKKVALGTLSFRVQKGKLPAVVAAFGGKRDVNFAPADGDDFLLKFFKATGTPTPPLWELGIFASRSSGSETRLGTITWRNHQDKLQPTTPVQSVITYTFPETILSVTPANPQVTVNAYQAFNKGDLSDLALTLQKYSPMVTATYQDGARRNLMMPWGRADAPGFDYGYTVKKSDGTALTPPYDPTGALVAGEGVDYQISQYFYYVPNDAAGKPLVGSDGKPVYQKVATPVTAQMAVTQVKATAVTADSLDMAFSLSGTSAAALATLDALQLPDRARIVTDVVPGGPSLTLPISGWTAARDNTNNSGAVSKWPNTTITSPEELDKLVADESLANPLTHWPTMADMSATDAVLQQRVGTYRFRMAPVAGGTANPHFTKEQLTKTYPWLTVSDSTYTLPDATRRLAMANVLRSTMDFDRITAVTDGGTGNVTLTVKISTAAVNKDFAANTTFNVYSPTGAEITPVTATPVGTTGYTLTFSFPAGTEPSAEALRRQINLGGVFWVTMTENGTLTSRYPAYVGPRENGYSEGKEYNFIGQGGGLYNWPGVQGTELFLPQGKFEALDANGAPLFVNADGNSVLADVPGAKPKLENYGVQTTYDGVVGSQPGVMQNFAAENWTKNVAGAVATYGPADFAATGVYGAYGQVVNAAASKKQVTLRTTEPDKTPTPNAESLTLTYETADNIAPDNALPDKRILATFNTQREGYAQRQDYTLTLTNSGETDIYGLFVDTTTFQDHHPISASETGLRGGGHFALLKPPATFLPAGASTTFTLTYVYDLRSHGGNFDYRDTLYITSTSHDKAVNTGAATVSAGEDILLKFDAKFTVSESAVHGVTVVTVPSDGSMGTAGLIVGQTNSTGTGADVMDLTAGSNAYPGKAAVYLQVASRDEYTIASVTYSGSGGSGVLEKYDKQGPQADPNIPADTEIYVLKEMPSYNIIITVTFEEPITSKLRLGALKVYGEARDGDLKLNAGSLATPTELPLLKKNITNENLTAAQRELAAGGYGSYTIDHVLMQMLDVKAVPATFDNTESHFIAVVPFTAEYVQLEGTLRAVLSTSTGLEGVKVEMKVFNEAGKAQALQNATLEVVDPTIGRTNDDPATPVVEGPTRHLSLNTNIIDNHNPVSSSGFPAPLPGKSKYVQIALSYTPSGKPTETRSYFIELHRNTEHTVAVPSAGNSPYGMIENDPLILPKDKDAAKKAFVAAGYRFAGVSQTEVPQYVKNTPLMNAVYSREAWANLGPYEPESGTGLNLYDAKNNLDLNDAALFVIPGQAFQDPGLFTVTDSSGREADKTGAYLTATVDLLDTTATTQTARFTSKKSVTLQLGPEGALVPKDWAKETTTSLPPGASPVAVRPGVYELVYHFKDVDSGPVDTAEKPWLTFKRPLVILSALGDVNVSGGAPDAADQTQIISRIGDPLGYTAAPYPGANLFRYRCCDANCDRNINNIDANELKANSTPRIGFYLPTGYRTETPVTP